MQVARCRTLCIQYNWQWSTILKRLHLCDITKLEPGSRKTLLQLRGWTYLHVGLIIARVVIVCIILIDDRTIASFLANT